MEKFSHRYSRKGFCPVTEITVFYIFGNVISHSRPLVIVGDKFHCSPATRVICNWSHGVLSLCQIIVLSQEKHTPCCDTK